MSPGVFLYVGLPLIVIGGLLIAAGLAYLFLPLPFIILGFWWLKHRG